MEIQRVEYTPLSLVLMLYFFVNAVLWVSVRGRLCGLICVCVFFFFWPRAINRSGVGVVGISGWDLVVSDGRSVFLGRTLAFSGWEVNFQVDIVW